MRAEPSVLTDANDFLEIHKVPEAARPMVRLAYLAGQADGYETGYEQGRFEGYKDGAADGYVNGVEQEQAMRELGL